MNAAERAHLNYLITTLEATYGRQIRYSSKSAMDQLIATILSQRTTYADERAAFDKLLTTYNDWAGVAAAPVEEIEKCIKTSRWPEMKAPRIKHIINHIIEEYGEANLDFLAEMPVQEVLDLLMKLPGVGHKTATFVALFTLRKPALPVDTHVHRVSTRFGIIPMKMSQPKAHGVLLAMLPPRADDLLNFHKLLFKHGQQVCTYTHPRCGECVLAEQCNYAREKAGK